MHALYVLLVTFGVIWIFLKYNKTVNEPFLPNLAQTLSWNVKNGMWDGMIYPILTICIWCMYIYIWNSMYMLHIYIIIYPLEIQYGCLFATLPLRQDQPKVASMKRLVTFVGKFADWKRLDAVLYAAKEYEAPWVSSGVLTKILGT